MKNQNDKGNEISSDEQRTSFIPITLYVQNLAGAASKIHVMNQKLATTIYDVFAFQETWFNRNTDTSALTANTDFILLRADRGNFANTKRKWVVASPYSTEEILM